VETARALVSNAPRALVPRQLPVPEPATDGAILRVEACGLCGTDPSCTPARCHSDFAFIPGHENHPASSTRWATVHATRGASMWATVSRSNRCAVVPGLRGCRAGAYGRWRDLTGWRWLRHESARSRAGPLGGYATPITSVRGRCLHPVPASLDPVLATMFNPLGAGVRWV